MRDSCMLTIGQWITNMGYNVFKVSSCDTMAWSFQNLLSEKYKEHFPQKKKKKKTCSSQKQW